MWDNVIIGGFAGFGIALIFAFISYLEDLIDRTSHNRRLNSGEQLLQAWFSALIQAIQRIWDSVKAAVVWSISPLLIEHRRSASAPALPVAAEPESEFTEHEKCILAIGDLEDWLEEWPDDQTAVKIGEQRAVEQAKAESEELAALRARRAKSQKSSALSGWTPNGGGIVLGPGVEIHEIHSGESANPIRTIVAGADVADHQRRWEPPYSASTPQRR